MRPGMPLSHGIGMSVSGVRGLAPKPARQVVVVCPFQGRVRFAICRDRSGEEIAHWITHLRQSCSTAGTELQPGRDDRPFHTVSPSLDIERYSIALRMDTKLGREPR